MTDFFWSCMGVGGFMLLAAISIYILTAAIQYAKYHR